MINPILPRHPQVSSNGSCFNKYTIMARRVGLCPCEVSSFFKACEKTLFALPRHGVWPTCGPNCAAYIAHSFPGTLGLFCRTRRLPPHMNSEHLPSIDFTAA